MWAIMPIFRMFAKLWAVPTGKIFQLTFPSRDYLSILIFSLTEEKQANLLYNLIIKIYNCIIIIKFKFQLFYINLKQSDSQIQMSMERLSASKRKRDESYLIKSKELISDMAQELSKMSSDLQKSQHRLQDFMKDNKELLAKNKTIQEELFSIKQNYKIKQSEHLQHVQKLNSMLSQIKNESLSKDIQQKNHYEKSKAEYQKQIKKLSEKIKDSEYEITMIKNQAKQQNNSLNLIIKSHQKQLNQLKRTLKQQERKNTLKIIQMEKELTGNKSQIRQLQKQKQEISRQLQRRQKQYDIELLSLRQINNTLKYNFQRIQRQYSDMMIQSERQDLKYENGRYNPKKRSQSYRGDTFQKRITHKMNNLGKFQNEKMRINPEMQQELLNIKRQIDNQYMKLQTNRDKSIKHRVDKTLATIQSLLSQMSQRVEISDSQNGF